MKRMVWLLVLGGFALLYLHVERAGAKSTGSPKLFPASEKA
jgi:hypothetical protein